MSLRFLFLLSFMMLPHNLAAIYCKERVSICFSGEYRSFGRKEVKASLLQFINGVKIKSSSTSVASFMYITVPEPFMDQGWIKTNNKEFNFVSVNVSLTDPPRDRVPYVSCAPVWKEFNSQFKKMNYCYEMIKAYEQDNKCTFQWIIRSRPDVLYETSPDYSFWGLSDYSTIFINKEDRPLGNGEYGQTGDHFAIIPRQLADVYFSMYNAPNVICKPLKAFVPLCHADWNYVKEPFIWPECMVHYYLREYSKVKVKIVTFHLTPVRSDGKLRGWS